MYTFIVQYNAAICTHLPVSGLKSRTYGSLLDPNENSSLLVDVKQHNF